MSLFPNSAGNVTVAYLFRSQRIFFRILGGIIGPRVNNFYCLTELGNRAISFVFVNIKPPIINNLHI